MQVYDRETPMYAVLVLNQGFEHKAIGLTDPLWVNPGIDYISESS